MSLYLGIFSVDVMVAAESLPIPAVVASHAEAHLVRYCISKGQGDNC